MQMVPLIGFAPDRPATTPGVMTACKNLVPTEKGFTAAPSGTAVSGVAALANACRGAALAVKIDGTRRIFAGTSTRLYELSGTSWTDVSRGTFYTSGADARWSFAQFGNATLASDDNAPIQRSNGSGAFADIATAPKAKVIFSVGDFVMALNTNDGTYGDQGDRWWCCGIFDDTSWTPSVSTQANTGRLIQGGGEIVAGLALGKQAVAYKNRAMFLGTYVGGAQVWQWDQIPGEQGAVGQEAVCDAGGVHFFVGEDNIWAYDGTRPTPVADDLRQWFFDNSDPAYRYKTILQYDRQNNRVWIRFAGLSSGGVVNSAITMHVGTRKWGRADLTVQAVFQYVAPAITIDGLTSLSATIDGLPSVAFDSQYWISSGRSLGYFDGSNVLRTLNGAPGASGFTSGDIGDDIQGSYISEVRLRFTTLPTTGSMTGECYDVEAGASRSGGSASSIYDGAFHARQSGRWHRFTFAFTGSPAFNAIGVVGQPLGKR